MPFISHLESPFGLLYHPETLLSSGFNFRGEVTWEKKKQAPSYDCRINGVDDRYELVEGGS